MGAFFLQFMVFFLFGNNFELYMPKIFTKYHGTSCKVSISFSLSYTKTYEIGWKGNSFKILKKSEIELSHCHRTNSPVLWMEGTVCVLQFQVRIGGFVRRQNHVPGNTWYVYAHGKLMCFVIVLRCFFSFWFLDYHVVNYWVDVSNWLIILQT